jgi:tetratricopeptide (TPR) repeat protein
MSFPEGVSGGGASTSGAKVSYFIVYFAQRDSIFFCNEQDDMCDIERAMLLQSGTARQSTYPIQIFSRWSSLARSSSSLSSFSSIYSSIGTMYSVHLFRERSPIHHEYVAFSFCRHSGAPPDNWLRVERAARFNARLDAPRSDSIGPIIGGAELRESISFSTTKEGLRKSPDDELASVVFDIQTKNFAETPSSARQNMLLDKLARQLYETSAASNRYRLLTENCRWFARRNMLSIMEHVAAAGFVYHPTWVGKPCTADRLRRKLGDETFGGRQLGGAKGAHINAKSLLDLAGVSILEKRFDDALPLCRKALGILEGISTSSPRVRDLHSHALNYLGISLNNLGQSLAALEAQKHACLISSEFSSEDEDIFFSTHNALVATLSTLGRKNDAAKIQRALVESRRRIHKIQSDTFSAAGLALLLLNYAIALADLPDRTDERTKAIQETVNLYRGLADQHPDLYRGDLGVALSEYAHVMDGAGRAHEAYDLSLEATSFMRGVFALHPEDCLEDLALHISNHTIYAAKAELWGDACNASYEAVTLYRRLYATRNPYDWRASLAGALSDLGKHLRCAGRPFDSVDAWKEAFGLYRILHARNPGKYQDHVGCCLREIADIVHTTPEWGDFDPSSEGTP